jgi:hypothetical protein
MPSLPSAQEGPRARVNAPQIAAKLLSERWSPPQKSNPDGQTTNIDGAEIKKALMDIGARFDFVSYCERRRCARGSGRYPGWSHFSS